MPTKVRRIDERLEGAITDFAKKNSMEFTKASREIADILKENMNGKTFKKKIIKELKF